MQVAVEPLVGNGARLLEREGEKAWSADAAFAMNRTPKTIAAGAFATEALRLMEEKKITSLFIVDGDGRPGGIVHLHDLWGVESI